MQYDDRLIATASFFVFIAVAAYRVQSAAHCICFVVLLLFSGTSCCQLYPVSVFACLFSFLLMSNFLFLCRVSSCPLRHLHYICKKATV